MHRDSERLDRIKQALSSSQFDVLICSLPMNVLMITGYWPVVGNSVAIATRDGIAALVVPMDERDLAERSWCDRIQTFEPTSLTYFGPAFRRLADPLLKLARALGIEHARIGYESEEVSVPASYSSIHLYQYNLLELLRQVLPEATTSPADDLLAQLRQVKTRFEIERIKVACTIAKRAFDQGRQQVRLGMTELTAASLFRDGLSDINHPTNVQRADGFVRCMSGSNSALAGAAYVRSRPRAIDFNDLVLVHCNSYADGYWTDITRTYCVEPPDSRKRSIYAAIFDARDAALELLRPGIPAVKVDNAARVALKQYDLDRYFTHSTGHEVGFGAISANDPPRLHPRSPDILEAGMVFNVEPAVYIPKYGGIRHCDMLAVTETGAELLTPFHTSLQDLLLSPDYRKVA